MEFTNISEFIRKAFSHKDSRTDKFCQGEQMLWEKWGLQGSLIINSYDMRYWINDQQKISEISHPQTTLRLHQISDYSNNKPIIRLLPPASVSSLINPILRLLPDISHLKITPRLFLALSIYLQINTVNSCSCLRTHRLTPF